MALVDQLKNLGLDYLDHGWVKAIYQTEFLEFCDLPPEYESAMETVDLNSTFEDIMMSTDSWLNSEAIPTEEKTWASLLKLIQHEKVLAILAYYINYGCKNVNTKEYRNNALLASRVYYKLLTIPGCKAYHIYHSQLFAHSLACLRFPVEMCDEASTFNAKDLRNEVNFVLEQLSEFVKDLTVVIKHLQLNPYDLNFEEILNNLVDVTDYEVVGKLHVDKLILACIVKMVYDIINALLCDTTGACDEDAIAFLYKCILPKLVNSCLDNRNTNVQEKIVEVVREDDAHFHMQRRGECVDLQMPKYTGPSYVTYSVLLLAEHGEPALNSYITLLEHLCTSPDGLERADVRESRSKLIFGLMSVLPESTYTEFMIWLIDLSLLPSKLPHRQIAVELLAKLLCSELPEQEDFIAGRSNEQEPQPNGDKIVAPVQVEQANVPAQPALMNGVQSPASVLLQRSHKVMHRKILRAIFDRTIDESATIRTRSLVILTKCLTSKHVPLMNAIKDLNGSGEVSRMVAVAARNSCDERAVVRKAAAGLLHQSLAHPDSPPPMRRELTFLVSLCRDASIIVRQSAIAGLAELLAARPSDTVLDAFLDGPLPQITDPEAKVQEQVLGLLEKLVIDRLRKFTAPECEDPMPWMFLAGIARRKKMAHLQKSCHKLKKSAKCINHRLVDILSSHLGVLNDERDVHCMLLLTSVAPHVDYSDLGFVFDYYYKLCDSEQFRDLRLMKLTLQLLGSWSRFMSAPEKTELLNHLVQRLAEARYNTSRIYSVKLAYQLNPENLTWATEMMQMSERRAVMMRDVAEAVRATDLSLTSPARPGPGLLRLLLDVANPPPDWDQTRCATAVAGAGRLCIRARDAAAQSAPVFATLLARVSEPLAVRVNALIALSDICARYTCIVEPLLGTMSDCLSKDTPVLLRRMGTFQLTRLLVGGFLRLRPPLYYRYCALLADGDAEVREPVEYYVTCGLTVETIYYHFVECVLHYNQDKTNVIKFDDRQLIYDLMLQRMTLVQKLNIQCRLARDVLEHAADLTDEGDEELPPEMNAALLDTITLLCGPRMKLPKKSQKQGEVNDLEDLQERVTTNIVSHKMKVQVAEVLVPAVLRLYNRLSPRGGQINTYLVQFANDLLKDYEQEIKELFQDNEELMKSVQRFQSTIGVQATFGNVRNLVTGTAPPEPETPRAYKRRAPRSTTSATSPRKRALRV